MPENYNISKIAEIIEGKLIGNPTDSEILHLVIDSRKINFPVSSLFFAIKGPQHDGHEFIQDAFQSGINHFIISDPKFPKESIPNACFVLLEDTLAALQKLASYHRKQFQIPIIGITGSNGKTIVKDWLGFVLSTQFNICKNPKSYNSQVGVPLSIWNLQEENEIGIFEAGISEPGEMIFLEKIINPTLGIFTNIGSAHQENFINLEEKIREKLTLFAPCEKIIVRNDDPLIEEEIRNKYPHKNLITWGASESSQFQTNFKKTGTQTEIYISNGDQNYYFNIPFSDQASIENACHVFITCITLNADMALVTEQMNWLSQVNMRLSFKSGKNQCFIVDDTYSNDFDSLKIAIDSLGNLHQYPQKTIILSDIAEASENQKELYSDIAKILYQKNITKVIGIGNEIEKHSNLFKGETHFYKNVNSFLQEIHELNFHHEAMLIKGARKFGLEKIVGRLENKVHDTIMEVNLNAMIHNLNYYRRKIPKGTQIMAMVKASGYGTGTHEIAHILHFHHVNYLSVAYADEGIELRNHGIKLPIMVMNAEATAIEILMEHQLEPVIYNFENLRQLLDHQKIGNKVPPIHIEIDTGMHRLGFDPNQIDELVRILQQEKRLEIKSIFSHLAAADEPEMRTFTLHQIELFKNIAEQIEQAIGKKIIKHIANSSGASQFKEATFDMIRLGVGLYGVGSDPNEQAKLQPVISLFSTVAQIIHVNKGESIGYGRSFIADKGMTIATVPIGYADGFRRSLSNGKGKMFVHGKSAPVIGRVCMDMTMIDITGIGAEVGDQVEIIGENYPIELFAKSMDTIPYEVLTSISQRVRRIYTQE